MDDVVAGVALLLAVVAAASAAAALLVVLRRTDDTRGDGIGAARTAQLERRIAQLAQRLEVLEREIDAGTRGQPGRDRAEPTVMGELGSAIRHLGLVRFDAFPDAGGAQSFALALLDDEGDGVILTSLHSRQATRVYVKDIRRGVADAPLSGEEEQALRESGVQP